MKKLLLATLLMSMMGCNSKKENAVLNEAFEVHKSMREVQKEVIQQWKSFDEFGTVQIDSALTSNKALYSAWKHDLLEVPGYPHIHLEGDDHEHHHHEQAKLPHEQILAIQKEAKKAIELIHDRNQKLLDSLSGQ
jgi:hypothetical protein